MLKDAKLHAAKNGKGGIYITIETVDALGHTNLRVIGDPPGSSLLERATAHGIMPESHADEFDEV